MSKINSKNFLFFSLYFLFFITLLLLLLRLYNTISFLEPLHVQTGGAEDTNLLSIWLLKNNIGWYNHFRNFGIGNEIELNMFSVFHYNWFYYHLNAKLILIYETIFYLDDLWFPTLIRINNFIFSLFTFLTLIKIFNLKRSFMINKIFSFFLILGPLTGFWVMSAKPDMNYILFEVIGIYIFIKNINNLNYKKLLIISLILFVGWSIKQTSITTLTAISIYLFIKKDYKFLFLFVAAFLCQLFLALVFLDNDYLSSIFWQNGIALEFEVTNLFKLLITTFFKIVPIFIILLCYIYFYSLNKKDFIDLHKNPIKLFTLLGFFVSLIQIVQTFHSGSAVNYYFIPTIYLSIYLIDFIHQIFYLNTFKNFKIFLSLGLIMQGVLIIMILTGHFGSTNPKEYKNVNTFKNCVNNIKTPVFSNGATYYRMPWITPAKNNNPILKTMMYEIYKKNNKKDYKQTILYKFIKEGKFSTLILDELSTSKFNLEKYKISKYCLANINKRIYELKKNYQ